jgi:hypothetical protein
LLWLVALMFCSGVSSLRAVESGPIIQLGVGHEKSPGNPVGDFMYFVPLISPCPCTVLSSPGSSQHVKLGSITRRFDDASFVVTCEFAFTGQGLQQSIFTLADQVHLNEAELKSSGSLRHVLREIDCEGAGSVTMEVDGTISDGVRTVNEVRLHFNAHGNASPISINMCDVRTVNGEFRATNEMIVRVNTLAFRRQPGPPKMEVTIASIKGKEAGNGWWETVKGEVKGAAVTLFLDPFTIEAAGHDAMLDFGMAMVSGSSSFTFPFARNLRESPSH